MSCTWGLVEFLLVTVQGLEAGVDSRVLVQVNRISDRVYTQVEEACVDLNKDVESWKRADPKVGRVSVQLPGGVAGCTWSLGGMDQRSREGQVGALHGSWHHPVSRQFEREAE